MPSSTEVTNMALSQVPSSPIANLDDADQKSKACKRIYDILLPAMLRDYAWNFAYTSDELAEDATAPAAREFAHQYTLLAGTLRVLKVAGSDKTKWREESGKILTNETAPLLVEWTRLETDPNKWDGIFVLAFATGMGSYLAGALAADSARQKELYSLFITQTFDAKAVDAQSQSVERAPVEDLIVVRTG